MAALDGKKYYEQGNYALETQEYTGTAADGKYTGEVKKWYGMMRINLTSNQEDTNIAADDDPSYLTMRPAMTMTGDLTLVGIKLADYQYLFNVNKDKNNMLLFGSKKLAKEVGMSFKITGGTEEGMVTNKLIFFRTTMQLPDISTESLSEDGTTIREVTIGITVKPVQYTDLTGQLDQATYGAFDSETNKEIWDKIKDGLFLPNATLTA